MHIQNSLTLPPQTGEVTGSWLDRLARRVILRSLEHLSSGELHLTEGERQRHFGKPHARFPAVRVQVKHPRFYTRLLLGGTSAAGESYADGDWDTSDLTAVIRLFAANQGVADGFDHAVVNVARRGVQRLRHRLRANTHRGSRRNIAAHYDLSNDFFKLWLDKRMMYSSALYANGARDLETASTAKLARLTELLELRPGMRVLEIGSGWGGLAIYLASMADVEVVTTTISRAQFEEATARVKSAGLEGRVTVLEKDYRDLPGTYDRIISVEMVEAVGDDFVDGYFHKVHDLLRPGGRFVMQAITIQDQRYRAALKDVDFIKQHIFPGSFIPSVTRLVGAASTTPSLRLVQLDDLGLDYARTLAAWSDRFAAARAKLLKLGYGDYFQRLWQFYFSYCAGGFAERAISDVHAVFIKSPEAFQADV